MTDTLLPAQEDAYYLVEIAVMLDQSRDEKGRLAVALDRNLKAWIGIATLVSRPELALSQDVKDNLKRLSDFVIGKTVALGADMPAPTLNTLVNINLQVSEGLLQSAAQGRARA